MTPVAISDIRYIRGGFDALRGREWRERASDVEDGDEYRVDDDLE